MMDTTPQQPTSLKRVNIQQLEDNRLNQELGKAILTQKGHHVDIASDEQEYLEYLFKTKVDVTLMMYRCGYGWDHGNPCHPSM